METRSSNASNSLPVDKTMASLGGTSLSTSVSSMQLQHRDTQNGQVVTKLPNHVLEYLRIYAKKKKLNQEARDLHQKILSMQSSVQTFLQSCNSDSKISLQFSQQEAQLYGADGSLHWKSVPSKEGINKGSLARLLYEFFQLHFKDRTKKEILAFAQAAVTHIYTNRMTNKVVGSVQRSFKKVRKVTKKTSKDRPTAMQS